jgi:hypothetical protein
MMKRAKGATLAEIMAATKWQGRTVRDFVSLVRKGGEKIESSKVTPRSAPTSNSHALTYVPPDEFEIVRRDRRTWYLSTGFCASLVLLIRAYIHEITRCPFSVLRRMGVPIFAINSRDCVTAWSAA